MSDAKRKVLVRTQWDVLIDVPADWDEDAIKFYVEENGCPGTGSTGSAMKQMLEVALAKISTVEDGGYCWACGYDDERGIGNGENKVMRIGDKVCTD